MDTSKLKKLTDEHIVISNRISTCDRDRLIVIEDEIRKLMRGNPFASSKVCFHWYEVAPVKSRCHGVNTMVPDHPDPPKPPARKIIFEVSCPACGLEWRVHHSDPNSGLDTRCRCVIPIPAKPANLKPEYKRAEVVVGVINNELWYGDKCVCEIERGQRCDLEAIAQQLNDCIKHKNDSIKYKKQYNRLSADL